MSIYIHCILPYLLLISYFYSCNLTILIIPEYYVPLYSAFEQVLLPGDTALYKCFLLLLLLLVTNTVNNSTHLRHASSLDYFNRTKDK